MAALQNCPVLSLLFSNLFFPKPRSFKWCDPFKDWIVTCMQKFITAFHPQPCKWTLLQWEYLPGALKENNVDLNRFLYLKPKLYQCFKIPTSDSLHNNLGSIWCLHCWHDFKRQGTEFCDCQFQGCIALIVHCKGMTYNYKKKKKKKPPPHNSQWQENPVGDIF